mgnify:CR=1 FL=1
MPKLSSAIVITSLLVLSGCGSLLCPEGYEATSSEGTYGVWKCEKEME